MATGVWTSTTATRHPRVLRSILKALASLSPVKSIGYNSGYEKSLDKETNLRDIETEVHMFRQVFPELRQADPDHGLIEKIREGEVSIDLNAERWGAVPRWQCVATTYGHAIERVVIKLKEKYRGRFTSYIEDACFASVQMLRESAAALSTIEKRQPGCDFLLISYQFGEISAGESAETVVTGLHDNEWPIDPFTALCLLMAHPERLGRDSDLGIICPGAVLCDNVKKEYVLCIEHDYDIELCTIPTSAEAPHRGAITGFFPVQE